MAAENLLAFDVGGSSIKYALWDGSLSSEGSVPLRGDDREDFIADIRAIVDAHLPVDGIAFSLPGRIDPATGLAHTGGAVRCLYGMNLREIFEEAYGIPVSVMNDAKCAALAELGFGALKGVRDAVVVVFGTGIGGALIVNGELVLGSHLVSGELSVVNDDIHDMASSADANEFWAHCGIAGLSRAVEEASGYPDLSGIEIFAKIREGDAAVEEGLRAFCRRAAWHLYNLQVITDPEVFAIGGGISNEPIFIEYLREAVDELADVIPQYFFKPELVVCEFRAGANLVGSAYAWKLRQGL